MSRHPPRFLVTPDDLTRDRVRLDSAEAKHMRVRRLAVGRTVVLFDGVGRSREARVERISRQTVEVALGRCLPDGAGESRLRLTLAVALLKADKLEWVIEKVTELGVHRVRPFGCRYSLGRASPRRRDRWAHIAAGAAKQCGRSVVPKIDEPVEFGVVVANHAGPGLFFWEDDESDATASLAAIRPEPQSVTIIVGPEGGFSPEEADQARKAGFQIVGLGPRILRADTAAIAAVTLCQNLWGDLQGNARNSEFRIQNSESGRSRFGSQS